MSPSSPDKKPRPEPYQAVFGRRWRRHKDQYRNNECGRPGHLREEPAGLQTLCESASKRLVANIIKAIDSACDLGGVSRGDVAAATLGLAGVRRRDIREARCERALSKFRVSRTVVTTDAEIALRHHAWATGVVVIAGTGSIAIGINEKGEKFIAGGWGPVAGDEGGGRGIAGEALHSVARGI